MMRRELFHIYGPFSVYSYGLAIAIGLVIFMMLCLRNKTCKKLVSSEQFVEIVGLSLVVGLTGARLLFLMNMHHPLESFGEIFAVWSGGLSVLGGIIAILLVIPWYLRSINVPVLPFLDVAALNAPLLHAISRLGCFMAGCCYGKPFAGSWAITYTDIDSHAPVNIPLHPTQLYTAALLLLAFFFFRFVLQKVITTPGIMLMIYLIVEGAIRFGMDYLRDDIEYFSWDTSHVFSAHQWISLGIIGAGMVGIGIVRYTNKETRTV